MRPLEAREGGGVVNGGVRMWRPWQLKQFELLRGVAVSDSSVHPYYTQQYMVVPLQSGVGNLQYRNTRESINATDGTFYVFEPGETCICQSKDVTFHGLCVDPAWLQQIATEMTQRERSQIHFPSHSLFDPSLGRILSELAVSSQIPVSRLRQGPALRKTPSSRKVDKCGTVQEKDAMSLTNGRFVLHVTNQVRLSTGLGDVGERQRKALGHVQGGVNGAKLSSSAK